LTPLRGLGWAAALSGEKRLARTDLEEARVLSRAATLVTVAYASWVWAHRSDSPFNVFPPSGRIAKVSSGPPLRTTKIIDLGGAIARVG
jgi:hypothetical protein